MSTRLLIPIPIEPSGMLQLTTPLAREIARKATSLLRFNTGIATAYAVFSAINGCPRMFQALKSAMFNWNCSLSDGMRLLARNGKFKAFDIGDGQWQDVDTPEALEWAGLSFSTQPRQLQREGEPAIYA